MNPSSRDGWPPSQGPTAANGHASGEVSGQGARRLGGLSAGASGQQQNPQQPPAQAAGSVLATPSAPFFSQNQPAGHNLPTLAGVAQPPHISGEPSVQPQPSSQESPAGSQPHHTPQMAGFPLPGINQVAQSQQHAPAHPNLEREREGREMNDTEMLDRHVEGFPVREAEQRERELRERQQREQAPSHEHHAGPIHIHQPVAVAPHVRSIHAPNGLLGNPGPMAGPNPLSGSLGAPTGPGNVFGGNPAQQGDVAARIQQQGQQAQQLLMPPFGAAQGVPQGPLGMGQGQQPILNDALSYLDQVKVQFVDHPDVYNRFLDIMKDFKSGAIDTPGVIERVSTLFAGNPNLIQGFNTFLPPGYKIECGTGDDPNAIRVTTPMGTTVSRMPAARPLSNPRDATVNGNAVGPNDRPYYDGAVRTTSGSWQQQPSAAPQEVMFSPERRAMAQHMYGVQVSQNSQAPLSPEIHNQQSQQAAAATAAALAHQQEQRGVSQLQNAVSAATGGVLPRPGLLSPSGGTHTPLPGQGLNGANPLMAQGMINGGMEKRGPVEFNHAISYVNKIKNRFASQPDIYKQFLEILQTYQRESKPIQDVYAQVTRLFETAPDLLEDFKQFLPESAAQAKAAAAARIAADQEQFVTSNMRNEPGYAASAQTNQLQHTPRADQARLPPMGNFAPTPTASRDNKRKRGDRQGAVASSAAMAAAMAPDSSAAGTRGGLAQNNVNRRAKQPTTAKQPTQPDMPSVSPTLIPALPEPLPPTTSTAATAEELGFFDKAKKFIGNKNTTNEFLKLCNLYIQDLIDRNTLLHRAQAFIGGNPELMNWFKNFIGYQITDEVIGNVPKPPSNRPLLSNCRGLGPSYRLLPKREQGATCGGRDELCKSVLNDEWASHPTWASEDSGFVAHRKNMHEEGLHRIEEERHDYDFNIEALARTVQLLDPIAQQLSVKPVEERMRFQLPPGLGGQSETIYKRVIMKLYGRERGKMVIETLFAQPWNVVPTLLTRLKMKLEEYKAAQREWEKVWRDQTQKIFWKSLDHQSINAKQSDKRQFQPKTLQNEIQVKYEEQRRQREFQQIQVSKWQFNYEFKDTDVLLDTAQLVLTYAEQVHSTDYPRLLSFVKEFVSLFFGLDPASFDQRIRTLPDDAHQADDLDDETPGPDDGSSSRNHKVNGRKTNLLRGVLERGRSGRPTGRDHEDSVASASRATTPEVASAADDEMTGVNNSPKDDTSTANSGMEKWLEHPTGGNVLNRRDLAPNEPYKRDMYNMYCNLSIYCFFRMFTILYERLQSLKRSEAEVHETVRRAQAPKPARDLNMIDKLPSDFFGDTSEDANYYQQVLNMLEEQIKGEMDMSHIEETLRRYYLQTGWQLYSFDRLMSALVRFGIAVFSNDGKDKSWEIYQLFKRDRQREETTTQDELNYRKQVEKHVKDGDVYRIAYVPSHRKAYVQIFKREDTTFQLGMLNTEKRWSYYISSYTSMDPTEGVELQRVRMPFIKRDIPSEDNEDATELHQRVKSAENLIIRIVVDNYQMRFAPATDEYLSKTDVAQPDGQESIVEDDTSARQREEDAMEKLVANNPWMRGLSKEDVDAKKQSFERQKGEDAGGPATQKGQEDEVMAEV